MYNSSVYILSGLKNFANNIGSFQKLIFPDRRNFCHWEREGKKIVSDNSECIRSSDQGIFSLTPQYYVGEIFSSNVMCGTTECGMTLPNELADLAQ
jgi:hypothetical protein